MDSFWIRSAAVAALAAASLQAHAASVTLTGWAFGNSNNVMSTMYSGVAGAFGGVLSGTGMTGVDTGNFVTYCIELSELFSFSPTPLADYAVVGGAAYFQDRRGDAQIAERLGRLLTYVSQSPSQVDTAEESTSMQLAVWNTVYDSDWSLSTLSAYRDFSAFRGHANSLLAGAQSVTVSSFDVHALQRAGSQDLLLYTQRGAGVSNAVPEPGSLALVAVALAGLGAARKRIAG